MKYTLQRSDDEINAQLNTATAWEDHGGSSVPGMSFEEGVLAGIRWLIGETEEWPIAEEPEEPEE
jgi:hypothetical protein